MPSKLSLGQVARLAREHDPAAWGATTLEEQRAMSIGSTALLRRKRHVDRH